MEKGKKWNSFIVDTIKIIHGKKESKTIQSVKWFEMCDLFVYKLIPSSSFNLLFEFGIVLFAHLFHISLSKLMQNDLFAIEVTII